MEETIKTIKKVQPDAKVKFLEVDLGDLRSVKKGSEEFLSFAPAYSTVTPLNFRLAKKHDFTS